MAARERQDCGMAQTPYRVEITLVEQPTMGCSQGYRKGDSWIVDRPLVPADMCQSVWDTVRPAVMALAYGNRAPLPGEKGDVLYRTCADFKRRLKFRVRRLGESGAAADAPTAAVKPGKRFVLPYAVRITCLHVPRKPCPLGYKYMDSWVLERGVTPENMCTWAWDNLNWCLHPFSIGAVYPGRETDLRDIFLRNCPSPEHEILFEVKRLHPAQREWQTPSLGNPLTGDA